MYKHILVPTDGSELSGKAVNVALELAKSVGARVSAFYATPEVSMVHGEGYMYGPQGSRTELVKQRDAHARELLESVQKRGEEAGVAIETEHEPSDAPFEAILRAAERRKCDLIVMASHGRRGISAVLLGSETQKVLTHSKLPVLVVR